MTDLSTLTAKRKADRETIAQALIAIAEKHGATVTRRNEPVHPGYHSGEIDLSFTLRGVGANIGVSDLHERHGAKGAIISWYNDYTPQHATAGHFTKWRTRYFATRFTTAVRSYSTWPGPHHKATSIGDWQQLADALDAGLAMAASDEAFQEEQAA